MRKLSLLMVLIGVNLWGCVSKSNQDEASNEMTHDIETKELAVDQLQYYGEKISPDGAINSEALLSEMLESDSISTKLAANIEATCKMKGCWMDVAMADGSTMKVTFKDYGFFVPKEGVEGKEAIIEGYAKAVETDVETLKHYAKDAGKSQEEIDQITEPKKEIAFVATGVIIKE